MRRFAALTISAITLWVWLAFAAGVQAQSPPDSVAAPSVTGTITDAQARPVAHAHVTAKNAKSAIVATADSDAAGKYVLAGLEPGDYEVTVSADGFGRMTAPVSVAGQQPQKLDLSLAPGQSAPPPGQAAPSLSDLGFSTQQTQGDPKMQALLQRRTEMLRTHQKLGLITAVPMAATLITGPMAKAKGRNGQTIKEPTDTNLDFHFALGAATGALYATTAYYAIAAPRVPGTHKHGAIRLHEALAFVHAPGMIATGALGYMAYKQESSGEKVHGIASAHGTVAYATAIAYGASIIAVSWPIHVKFWEKKQ